MSHRLNGGHAATLRSTLGRGFFRVAATVATGLLAATGGAHADSVRGTWDTQVYSWPLIPVHAVLTPDMRVMSYGTTITGQQTGFFVYDLWDFNAGLTGGHLTLDNVTATDIFCGSQLVLPQGGQVFLAGGDNWTGTGTTNTGNNNTNLLNLAAGTLSRGNNINRNRWYSTSTALLNGEVLIQGGSGGTDFPEVRATDGTFRLLSTAPTGSLDATYPRNFIAPDGRVFGYDSNGRMYYLNPTGTGSIATAGQFAAAYRGNDASAAMFRPGRILQFGGSSNGAAVIDITSGTPTVTASASMSSQRRLVNAAILPDGRVLATGGSQVWNQMTGVNYSAEIWNPATGTWTAGPDAQRARLYHSISVLLPDARVLVGGGGAPGPQTNRNVEIYNPPYLFDETGNRAVQARLTAAPADIDIGDTFFVDFTDAADISRVTMVKTASVTHSWNMEQRFIELPFQRSGSRLRIQGPTRAADAPPGFWMIFAINEQGVPSHARMLKINIASIWNPAITPTLTNPGPQSSNTGTAVSLQLAATDPNGDVLGYGGSGLPPGVTVNPSTGLISGVPTTPGSYNVVVAASDGINNASQAFVWTVTGVIPPLVLNPPPPPASQVAGSVVTYTASSSDGLNPQFRWQFDDGTPMTGWSASPTVTHTFTQPGIYYVTLMATDDTGVQRAETFVQTIHLPQTANRPTASSNIAVETRAAGNPRVWVVNQDNDTVSAFDAVTSAKLAEIAVGQGPRAVAVAPNGRIWVANKFSATLSVIDPSTLAVVQTVAMPRASQPYGIAFTPGGASGFVALEGLGQLVKLDLNGANQAILAVGANPRHVSVSADGASVYVSRFITPRLPGEDTASVQLGAGGAEVVQVAAGAFSVAKTITLAHGNKPDSEAEGRGIPNYLGAAVVSPDGTQAWVPSKQDNIARGTLRDGSNLNFQNTVRAISSRINLSAGGVEDLGKRIDHDDSSVGSAVAFDPRGVYLFVSLETSREVAVVDAHDGWEIFRFDVGRAPQGLALSPDGSRLFVNNFMDRTVGVFDLSQLLNTGVANIPALATLNAVATERLTAQVLNGKRFFYDARDPRLSLDSYMSCASCHNDGGQDGRVWDLTGMGEGLRNTVSLRGRAALGQGFLHWTGNFDELQDFEGQIRQLAGGTGLMTDAAFNTGTRSQPLGTTKAGVSADLDALAAYVASLSAFDSSPYRNSDGTLTATAVAGRGVFESAGCATCHGGTAFTNSGAATLMNVGTLKASSGTRLGAPLSGIDPPTLRDVWATAPYLHNGSAATIADAVKAHTNVTLSDAHIAQVAAYLQQIGDQEIAACPCSIWKADQAPPAGSTDIDPTGPIELGTRFRASANGNISAIRFYKHAGNTGVHVGSLWSATGTLLGQATFSGETASGWQQVNLPTPVPVTANTWYVASYHTRSGQYVGQDGGFTASGITNGPLHAARDGDGGGNGLFRYTANSAFPNQTYLGESYWVDVVYVTSTGPDTVSPAVSISTPTTAATHTATTGAISIGGTASDNVGVTQVTWSSDRGGSGTATGTTTWTASGVTLQTGSNVITVTARDAAGNSSTDALTVTYEPDSTAPVIAARTPAAGATGVPVSAVVTVTFSEALDASTVNGNTVQLRNASNALVSASVSYNATTYTATLSPSSALATTSTYTVTVRGGAADPRIKDSAGNALAGDATWTFATLADTTAPVVTITGPTNAATYNAATGTLNLSGTASDNVGVTQVNWSNNRGGSGTASGTGTWNAAGIALAVGVNALTVTAQDAAGNSSSDRLDVTYAPDITPPAVTARTPAVGATNVARNVIVTATFGEALDPTSVNGSSVELRNAANALVAATVAYNSATSTISVAPTATLAATSTYTVIIKGGVSDPRVKDAAGNALAATTSWSFTTTASSCPCSIWNAAQVPAASHIDIDGGGQIELGTRFRSSINGTITAIRFYKHAGNTGTHVGSLWSATGTLLGRVTFSGETASGWQTATLATPVAITANTWYVVSYSTRAGQYIGQDGMFASSAITNGPLTAARNGDGGSNGLYRYTTSNAFPNQTYQAEGYWVDVVFAE